MKKVNLGAAVAFTGLAVNLALFLVKLYVAVSCNSLSIYLDSINNGVDSLVCVAVGLGFILSKKGATKNFPFGFGRTEGVVNFLVSVIILVTGMSFAYSSFIRIIYPLPIWHSSKYALTVAFTIPVKLLLLVFYRCSNRKINSQVLKSLSLDSALDFFITLCSLAALTFPNNLGYSVDGIAGMVISVILIIQGVKIVNDAFSLLIGKRDERLCEKIEIAVEENVPAVSVDSVQCHIYGNRKIANLTVKADKSQSDNELINDIKNALTPDIVDEVFINTGG